MSREFKYAKLKPCENAPKHEKNPFYHACPVNNACAKRAGRVLRQPPGSQPLSFGPFRSRVRKIETRGGRQSDGFHETKTSRRQIQGEGPARRGGKAQVLASRAEGR